MPVTANELAYAREWIGHVETDDAFEDRVDRLSAEHDYDERLPLINDAILSSMREQLNGMMLDQPGNASVGSVSYSNSTNIQELNRQIDEFSSLTGATGMGETAPKMARLVRPRKR